MSETNPVQVYSRVKLYPTQDDGVPVLLHSNGSYGFPLEAFGYGLASTGYEIDDQYKRKPYWSANSTVGYDVGESSTNILLGDHLSRAVLFDNPRFNRGQGALCFVVEGGFYEEVDPSKPCSPDWVLRMNRPIGETKWSYPALKVERGTLKLHPQWRVQPGNVTAAIAMGTGTGNVPAIVWAKDDGSLGVYSLSNAFEDSLLPEEAKDAEENAQRNFREIPFNALPMFSNMENPVVRRGKREGRALADGLPPFFVSVKWFFLEKFGISERDRRELSRFWLTADSFDGKDWFNLRLTRHRDSYLPIALAGEEMVNAATEVKPKPKKTKAKVEPTGDGAAATEGSTSQAPPSGEVATGEGASAAAATPATNGKAGSKSKSSRKKTPEAATATATATEGTAATAM